MTDSASGRLSFWPQNRHRAGYFVTLAARRDNIMAHGVSDGGGGARGGTEAVAFLWPRHIMAIYKFGIVHCLPRCVVAGLLFEEWRSHHDYLVTMALKTRLGRGGYYCALRIFASISCGLYLRKVTDGTSVESLNSSITREIYSVGVM